MLIDLLVGLGSGVAVAIAGALWGGLFPEPYIAIDRLHQGEKANEEEQRDDTPNTNTEE